MDLEELKKHLKSIGVPDDKVDAEAAKIHGGYSTAIETEKNKGISLYQTKDAEGMKTKLKLKALNEELTKLGYDETKHANLDGFVNALKDPKKYEDLLANKNSLEGKMTGLIEKMEAMTVADAAKTAKTNRATMTLALSEGLSDKLYGAKHVINSLLTEDRVKINDSDKVVGLNNGSEVSLDDFLKTVMEENKDMVKSSQGGGSGGSGGSPGGGGEGNSILNNPDISVEDALASIGDIQKEMGLSE